MSISELVHLSQKPVIIEEGKNMSAPQPGIASLVNPIDLSAEMGISFDVLAKAAHADVRELVANPTLSSWQPGLRTVAVLWHDLTAAFGGEENARVFLKLNRPELINETPLYYLQRGEPEIVQNLVNAMREMLP